MIFDAERVSTLIVEYKRTNDPCVLDEILVLSRPLVEVITIGFGFRFDRKGEQPTEIHAGFGGDDVVQDCLVNITKAIKQYDPTVSNTYNYFTSVIRNKCKDLISKISKDGVVDHEFDTLQLHTEDYQYTDDSVLKALITRNRQRFPSIASDIIDDISEYILQEARDGVERQNKIVRNICDVYGFPRQVAVIIFQSTYIHMRAIHRSRIDASSCIEPDEFSLLPDLKQILGGDYGVFIAIFSGTQLKIP